jgi:lincosamide nucleotidyltransferase A/C/D/E
MNSSDVLKIYNDLKKSNVLIWVDGGWCVDALLGKQSRDHPDLDIAIERTDAIVAKELLTSWGYVEDLRDGTTEWNFVMIDENNRQIDVHIFEYDETGKNVYGINYPYGSLTGTGTIDGQKVYCISPEWMFKFKTSYTPKPKDIQDVQALAAKYNFQLPSSHQLEDK